MRGHQYYMICLVLGGLSSSAPAAITLPSTNQLKGSCGKDSNKITFNVNGEKDYFVGRDLNNGGDGWYFSAQGGEIVRANKDDELCVQTGMRPTAGNKSDAGNTLGPQKCGPAINQTRKVEGSDGSVKEYQWQWHKNASGKGGYLTITPLTETGAFGNPVLKLSGTRSEPTKGDGAGAKTDTSLEVEVNSIPGADAAKASKWRIKVGSENMGAGSSSTEEKVCSLGKLTNDSDKDIGWNKDLGVVDNSAKPGSDGQPKTVTADWSPASK